MHNVLKWLDTLQKSCSKLLQKFLSDHFGTLCIKVGLSTSKIVVIIYFNESSLKMMKNAIYFMLQGSTYLFEVLPWKFIFHNLSDQRRKHMLVQQISPSHRTSYFWQLLETNLLPETTVFSDSTNIYLFKFNNTNSRIKCKTCSKLTIESIGIVLVSSLFTLNIFDTLF